MSNYMTENEKNELRSKIFYAAAKMFLERGYCNTTTRSLADYAGVNVSTMNRQFGSKENILCELIYYVMRGQFRIARELTEKVTEDMILYYAVETSLQLYMAESDEAVRELYLTAYSLPHASEIIHRAVSKLLLPKAFSIYLPGLSSEEFYQMEIASGGIIRGYIGIPCTPIFPMERKVERFLDAVLRVYHVPEEKIRQAVDFVNQYDLETIAKRTIASLLQALENHDIRPDKSFSADQGDLQIIPKEEII